MSAIHEKIVSLLLPAIKEVEKTQLISLLNHLKTKSTDQGFKDKILSMFFLFDLLRQLSEETRTKIDDGLVSAALEAISQIARENNIDL